MWGLTRRQFLKHTSVGVGVAVGAAAALPRPLTALPPAPMPTTYSLPNTSLSGMRTSEPMVIHVRDMATAEISVFIGTRELVYRAPELIARLVQTATEAAETQGVSNVLAS